MKSIVSVIAILAICSLGTANASSYGFDDLLDPDGTPVGSCDVGGVHVAIENSSTNPTTLRTYESSTWVAFSGHAAHNDPLDPGEVSYPRFISTVDDQVNTGFFNEAQPITFTFGEPVQGFCLTTLDLLEHGAGAGSHVELTAYDEDWVQIDQHARTGEQGASGLALVWEVTADAIKYVRLTGVVASGQGGYGLDCLTIGQPCPNEDLNWGPIKMLFR